MRLTQQRSVWKQSAQHSGDSHSSKLSQAAHAWCGSAHQWRRGPAGATRAVEVTVRMRAGVTRLRVVQAVRAH